MRRFVVFIIIISCLSCLKIDENQDSIVESIETKGAIVKNTLRMDRVKVGEAGDVLLKSALYSFEDDIVSALFAVESQQTGDYYLSVFMSPEDNSVYTVSCNDKILDGTLSPQKQGWQNIVLKSSDGKNAIVRLKSGINSIKIFSDNNECPEIEILKLVKSEDEVCISETSYNNYLNTISVTPESHNPLKTLSSISTRPYVEYQFVQNVPLTYSFTKSFLHYKNYPLKFTITNITTPVIFDIFTTNSLLYTFSYMCLTPTPQTITLNNLTQGYYTIHLRRVINSNPGTCMVILDYGPTRYTYGMSAVGGYNYQIQSDNYTGGNVNFFTCCSSEGTDPILYLDSESSAYPPRIHFIDDDYNTSGSFVWENNARLVVPYNADNFTIHVSNQSAENAVGLCDLYVRMPYFWTSYLAASFPFLMVDDTILSAEPTNAYNCIGWAGDLQSYEWPPYPASPYYVSGGDLACFDNFFSSRGYTRVGATLSNAGVALWRTSSGFTHASVRNNNASVYPHGYDWESKIGAGVTPRIFHVRNGLRGSVYGSIAYYYKPIQTNAIGNTRPTQEDYCIEAPIKEKSKIIYEQGIINHREEYNCFNSAYNELENHSRQPELAFQSCPEALTRTKEYIALVEMSRVSPRIYAAFAIYHLFQGDIKAGFLLDDIASTEFRNLKDKAYRRYERGKPIVPSMIGNFNRLAYYILDELYKDGDK